MGEAYAQIQGEPRVMRALNYEGDVGTKEAFFRIVTTSPFFAIIYDADRARLGLVWLNRLEHRRAYVHFCVFKKSWGHGTSEVGRFVIRELFDLRLSGESLPAFDVLMGLVPESNSLAVRFGLKCGFKRAGAIPGYFFNAEAVRPEAAIVLYCTREMAEAT